MAYTYTGTLSATATASENGVNASSTGAKQAVYATSSSANAVIGYFTGTAIQSAIGAINQSTGAGGVGLWGSANSASTAGIGVYGEANGPAGTGVKGATTGNGAGIWGVNMTAGGIGVLGESSTGAGVRGNSTGGGFGVFGTNSGIGAGICGFNSSSGPAVKGENTGSGSGVVGSSTALNTAGVSGSCSHSGGHGVAGVNSSVNGIGVYGSSPSGTGSGAGVYGTSAATALFAAAVRGVSTGNQVGVRGDGLYGVVGVGTSTGVYGSASPGSLGGYFTPDIAVAGNAQITGSINASTVLCSGAKCWVVDHPLDPENKELLHACVESPERKNIYDGVGRADSGGNIVVRLPDYFESINVDFRYQLTPIGKAAPALHIKEKLVGNQFTIGGAAPGQEVCWMVTATMNAPAAKLVPFVAEREKSPALRGYFHSPEAYGQPQDKSIAEKRHRDYGVPGRSPAAVPIVLT